jgi:L-ascorbate metabolism protein UlaG (beta-lactamase superfamily)
VQLTWLGAAGFKLDTSEGATLLIDPFLSRSFQAKPALTVQLTDLYPVDEILLTNGRFDHAMDTPALTAQTGAIVHAPESICRRLAERGVSKHSLESLTLHKEKRLGSLIWRAMPSLVNQLDSSPVLRALTQSPAIVSIAQSLDRAWPLDEIVAYYLQVDGLSLVHFGSAGWLEPEIRGLQPDVALLPVECHPNTNADVIRLAARLTPKLVIPHHWDDYYPPVSRMNRVKEFEAAIKIVAPGIKVYVPVIGQKFTVSDLL